MAHPLPGRPKDFDFEDVQRESRKVLSIGADIAASLIRRCDDEKEAVMVLHQARTFVSGHFKSKSPEGKHS